MISIQSKIRVAGISGTDIIDFLLNCTDREYQAWWRGTHLAFHTIERRPGNVGNVVYMDEFIGKRRVKMRGIVTEVVPGKKVVWQFKEIFRLPVRLLLKVDDDDEGVAITHTIQAGFKGMGRHLDPLFRIYFSDEFERAMDEHAKAEFLMLRDMLLDSAVQS